MNPDIKDVRAILDEYDLLDDAKKQEMEALARILGLPKKDRGGNHDWTRKDQRILDETRAIVLGLIKRNLAIRFAHLNQAPKLKRKDHANLRYANQWRNMKSQHLIPMNADAQDGEEIMDFILAGKSWVYTTTRKLLRKAIAKVAKGKPDEKWLIAETRRQYEEEFPKQEAGASHISFHRDEPQEKEDLTEEEQSIVTASPVRDGR